MWTAIRFSLLMFILFGLLYPLAMTGLGQALFPAQARGSLIYDLHHQVRGSSIIAQAFSQPEYFHPRPSVNNYDASNSGGSNLGATSKKLIDRIQTDAKTYQSNNNGSKTIPIDAVAASASGLDPHISLANAMIQAPRVAQARHMSVMEVTTLIQQYQEKPYYGTLGEPAVNVMILNLALDQHQERAL